MPAPSTAVALSLRKDRVGTDAFVHPASEASVQIILFSLSFLLFLRGLVGRHTYRRVLRAGPGIAHAVGYRDRAEHGDHPQHWSHAVEKRTEDDQDQPFGAFHESDAAGADKA